MPQLNIPVSDALLAQLEGEATKACVKRNVLARSKLAKVCTCKKASVPVEATTEDDSTVLTLPSAVQIAGQTGMPVASCVRMLRENRWSLDGDKVLLDGNHEFTLR